MGSRQFNTFGAHGSSEHVDFCHYPTLEECVKDLKENKGALLSKRCARQHCDAAPTRRTCNLTRNPCRQPPTGCTVVGVEIMDGARSVHSFPFKGNTAFMLGNEVKFRRRNRRQFCLLPVVDLAARFANGGCRTASSSSNWFALAARLALHKRHLYATAYRFTAIRCRARASMRSSWRSAMPSSTSLR